MAAKNPPNNREIGKLKAYGEGHGAGPFFPLSMIFIIIYVS